MVFGEVVDGCHIMEMINDLAQGPGRSMLAQGVEVRGGQPLRNRLLRPLP